jgi:hypothetical protein
MNLKARPARVGLSELMEIVAMSHTLPESLLPLEREIATYYRELPRLIAEGHEGRYALIRDDQLVQLCDTSAQADALGHEKFGFDRFMAQKIRAKDISGLAQYFTADAVRVGA